MTPLKRLGYLALGWTTVALGVIGVFVPGLPTTVFLLIASFAFSKSSPKLRARLWSHRVLGEYLRMAAERAMPMRAKVVSWCGMWGGIAFGAAFAPMPVTAAMVAAGLVGTICVARLRTASGVGPTASPLVAARG